MLCSDGLVDEVADVDIASTLAIETDPQVAADRLVEKANEAGGRDNITVVVLDVLEGDDPPDPTQELDVVPVWAEAGTDPTPAGTLELDPDAASSDNEGFPAEAETPDRPSAPRRRSTPARLRSDSSPQRWWSSHSSCSRRGRGAVGSSRSTTRTRP